MFIFENFCIMFILLNKGKKCIRNNDEIIENAMMFDGKLLTDDDKRAIRGIIAGYMSSKEK